MKSALWSFLLLYASTAFGQSRVFSQHEIDQRVRNIPAAPAAILSHNLTSVYSTDREKVRAIFTWVATNISYRVKKRYSSGRNIASEAAMLETIDSCRCKSANEIVAESVILVKEAVCEGYAKLFKTLCDYAGLRAVIITGFGRTNIPRSDQKFRSNHSWNAVYLDGSWQLLDLTWASGYISYFGDEFIPHINETYYLSEPARFAEDHVPDDLRWTLLTQAPVSRDYHVNAFRQRPFVKYDILSYQPSRGMIEAAQGDTLYFSLDMPNHDPKKKIAADTLSAEASLLPQGTGFTYLEPSVKGKKVVYQYFVSGSEPQWILLLYNGEPILRYRLQVQPTSASRVASRDFHGYIPPF